MSDDDRTIPQIDAEISHYQGKIDAITEARAAKYSGVQSRRFSTIPVTPSSRPKWARFSISRPVKPSSLMNKKPCLR